MDHIGKSLVCKATNPLITQSDLFDSMDLNIDCKYRLYITLSIAFFWYVLIQIAGIYCRMRPLLRTALGERSLSLKAPTTDMWWLPPKFFTANIIFGINLGFICFRPEIQSFFCKKNQPNTQNHEQGTHSAKMDTVYTVVWPKIPKMPLHISAQFVCPSPKVWDFWKKALWVSVRAFRDKAKVGPHYVLHFSVKCRGWNSLNFNEKHFFYQRKNLTNKVPLFFWFGHSLGARAEICKKFSLVKKFILKLSDL